ncbi:MAG: type II secretion system F family protein [Myxococcales bacterium]|nr:type II secretion system F family protein [Myxococcales bacterium]MDH5567775.1 type II secretion system F family protein [Myxococcales bacterium]
MPIYTWKGRTRQGALKRGDMEAVNEAAVMAQLRAQSLLPVSVKAKSKNVSEYLAFLKQKIKIRELVIFTRQFATMIDAGLPLVQCLEILGDQEPNKTFKGVIRDVKAEVEQGSTFADALRKHPKPFDNLYVNLVQAGEIGGILDTILNRLSVYLEKADALARKVKGAMVYPTTVLIVAIGVVVLMLVKVIPTFEKMFEDFGGELPGPTQVVVNLSHFMQDWIGLTLGVVFAAIVAFLQARKRSRKFRRATDAMFLKAPIFGPLLQKVAVARFTRTLGTMIASGVPILDGLDIVAKTAGNLVIEEALMDVKAAISEGKTIAEPLREAEVFPGMVTQMISVGEETGAMENMLSKIADFYDEEVDTAVDALTSLLEPVMMVFLGGSIGGLLIAMYLPIFKIADTIG